jgi:hypothetical protein
MFLWDIFPEGNVKPKLGRVCKGGGLRAPI